jgi:hypothetical protein
MTFATSAIVLPDAEDQSPAAHTLWAGPAAAAGTAPAAAARAMPARAAASSRRVVPLRVMGAVLVREW